MPTAHLYLELQFLHQCINQPGCSPGVWAGVVLCRYQRHLCPRELQSEAQGLALPKEAGREKFSDQGVPSPLLL